MKKQSTNSPNVIFFILHVVWFFLKEPLGILLFLFGLLLLSGTISHLGIHIIENKLLLMTIAISFLYTGWYLWSFTLETKKNLLCFISKFFFFMIFIMVTFFCISFFLENQNPLFYFVGLIISFSLACYFEHLNNEKNLKLLQWPEYKKKK